jgi:hypothetical protein
MRRLELLINQSRRATENEDLAGIKTIEFEQYMNNAQDRLQSLIHTAHPESDFFAAQGFISLTSGQDAYNLQVLKDENGNNFNSRILAFNSVILVERTEGNAYFPLKFISSKERRTGYGYFLRNQEILIAPPATGNFPDGIRLTYAKKLRDLGIRRGQITSLSPLTITALGDATDLNDTDWLTIVDKDGVAKVDDVEMGGWNPGTGVITTSTDVSAAAIGDYVVYGEYSTTHCELPDICERYLLEFCNMKIFLRDSSGDANAQVALVKSMENDILELFKDNTGDVVHVPISSTDYMIW